MHNADFFRHIANGTSSSPLTPNYQLTPFPPVRGNTVRGSLPGEYRGHPLNAGDSLTASHPVVRTNPVTGWKSVFVNRGFTRRINELTKDESDRTLQHIFSLITQNHDLQVRFKWEKYEDEPDAFDVAIWDNRSSYHTATEDYLTVQGTVRTGDRVVSLGETPEYVEGSKSRREALGVPKIALKKFY